MSPAAFLHGFEFLETALFKPVQMVRSSVIGLVGTSPIGATNQLKLVKNRTEAVALFGEAEIGSGWTIPQALDAILDQGDEIGFVVVVNVFDPALHLTAVTDEEKTFDATSHKLTLAHRHVSSVVVKNTSGTTTYTVGTDYTVNAITGVVTRVTTGTITAGQTVDVSYSFADPTLPTNADIIGGVDGTTGNREGIEALIDCSSIYGFAPKILIAPEYSSNKLVMDTLLVKAVTLRSVAIADQVAGATQEQAIAYRNQFDHQRAIVVYPWMKTADAIGNEVIVPFSPYLAGVMSRTDNQLGFWYSPSNKPILGITGLERPIPYITFHSPDSMANYLNELKIVTAIHHEGYRVWGNRSASSDAAWHFIAVRRQFDIIEDSIELGTLHLLDRPINRAFFEDLEDTVQAFLNGLVGRQALIYGKIRVLAEDNPPEEIASGHVTARLDITPTYPAERITYNVTLDIEPLRTLFDQA